MERVNEARQKALKNIKIADHILTQTYPLVNDAKLLLAVLENVFLSLTSSMAALLYYEKENKRIPPFQDNFESKYNMFKLKVAQRYNIDLDYIKFIYDIKNLIVSHRKSPMEFRRRDVFVICSDNYRMQTVSASEMKKHVEKAKAFIQEVDAIINKKKDPEKGPDTPNPVKRNRLLGKDFLFR